MNKMNDKEAESSAGRLIEYPAIRLYIHPVERSADQPIGGRDDLSDVRLVNASVVLLHNRLISETTGCPGSRIHNQLISKSMKKKETVFIAFATQKGGAGKTTLSVLAASCLHYLKGYVAAVIDCDYPQHSIADMRDRDADMVLSDAYYKHMAQAMFSRVGKPPIRWKAVQPRMP
jgi:hypothetical protein